MRNAVLFTVCLVAGAAVAALATRPAPTDDAGDRNGLAFALVPDFAPRDEEEVERVEASGELPATVQACALPGSCQLVVSASRTLVQVVDRPGLARLDLTVDWRASSPATRDLVADLLACGDPCSQDARVLTTASGASPLVLAYTPLPGDAFGAYTLRLRLEDAAPGPSEAYASASEQPFAVLGAAAFR